ncbi:helix-turn-helix domain-containing protein [Acidaminococcus fermentans]|uniref:helix-turn-helix domain-containing protein n=2 Tax=Acidaminococcus TaxID=904 RepID=UPI00242A63DC|nr:helix-turn-helix domain-containing protein [Acidaminococcus fermentans]
MLPEDIRIKSREEVALPENGSRKQTGAGLILPLRELEKNAIRQALFQYGNHTAGKAMAARKLGIGMATLYRKIQQYGL